MFAGVTKIIEAKHINEEILSITVENPVPGEIKPGQFFNIQTSGKDGVHLRRPISVWKYDDKTLSFLIKIIGRGTAQFAELRDGDGLNIMGPLGNGFSIDDSWKNVMLVGGGIGIAPLCALAEQIKERSGAAITIRLGFKERPYSLEDYVKNCHSLQVYTEEPCIECETGYPVKGLQEELESQHWDAVLSCGPEKMMEAVYHAAKDLSTVDEVQVSLEERMACGIGACLCCAKDGGHEDHMLCVCKDGPVFKGEVVYYES